MVQSPSWEVNWFVASQEIPRISRNAKVHYRTHKRPPNVSILGQPNPVHIPTFLLLEIHPNIIHPSTPRSPQWSPSLRFPQHDPIHPPLLTDPYLAMFKMGCGIPNASILDITMYKMHVLFLYYVFIYVLNTSGWQNIKYKKKASRKVFIIITISTVIWI